MEQLYLLSGVLAKDQDLLGRVGPDQWDEPTPCAAFNVRGLASHMIGWLQAFASVANGGDFTGDPDAFRVGDDAAGEFETAGASLISGWRTFGTDRPVTFAGREMPGEALFGNTLMEYVTHGWDLANATGQISPFTDEEATEALARARQSLPDRYRGEGRWFAEIVVVPEDAAPIDQLVGFMGRHP
jgi:uncharacterized protein (TIGR03086 family)